MLILMIQPLVRCIVFQLFLQCAIYIKIYFYSTLISKDVLYVVTSRLKFLTDQSIKLWISKPSTRLELLPDWLIYIYLTVL